MATIYSNSLLTKIGDFINLDSFVSHSHTFGLFFLYLFVHFLMASGSKSEDSPLVRSVSSLHPNTFITKSRRILGETVPFPIRSDSSQSAQSDDEDDVVDDDETATVTSSIGEETALDDTALEKSCPESTPAERQRFVLASKGHNGQANQRLHNYLHWKRNHERIRAECNIRIKQSSDPDYDVWVESCLVALKACGEVAQNIVLPRVVRSYSRPRLGEGSNIADPTTCEEYGDVVDQDGHRIFHMIPGLMDDKLAKTSTYALAVAIYFDRKFDRASLERATVCIDVRAGKGWPNIHGLRLIPFMKNSLKLLLPTFPERLHKCVVYPVPTAFLYVWTMISKCLDSKTREKIYVVSGKCTIISPAPMEKLIAVLGEEPAKLMEGVRLASFKA